MEEIEFNSYSDYDIKEIAKAQITETLTEKVASQLKPFILRFISEDLKKEILEKYDAYLKEEINKYVWKELQVIKQQYLEEIKQMNVEINNLKRRDRT